MKPIGVLLGVLLAIGVAAGVNILPNPSFEVWLDTIGVNLPLGWLTSELAHPGSAMKDPNSHSGSWCVHLVASETSAYAATTTIVREGYSYRFAGWVRTPQALGGSFVLEWLTMLGSPIGMPVVIPTYYSTGYREYSRWVTAPESAFFIVVSFATLPGIEAYLDDVTLDDTALAALEEEAVAVSQPVRLRKVVVANGQGCWPITDGCLFDLSGRRIQRQVRPGVYFVLPKAAIDRHR
ncbi:MAG: hypothetical protein ABIK44_02960 [candidate division WOR-3 bacterium]